MKNILHPLLFFIAGLILGGALFYFFPVAVSELPAAPPDTLISSPDLPDTVYVERVKTRYITRWRTVFRDTGKVVVKVERDTLYRDTTLNVFVSRRSFKFPYVENQVSIFARMPVDSLDSRVVVRWNDYLDDKVRPQFRQALRRKRWQSWRNGALVGLSAGLFTAILLK